MLCFKLAAPYLHRDQDVFHTSASRISTVTNDLLHYLANRYKRLLRWHHTLTLDRLKAYTAAIEPFRGEGVVWAFIDGTFRPFYRPLNGQRLVYSGHKKQHGSKWQAIITPDGLLIALDGPYKGQ